NHQRRSALDQILALGKDNPIVEPRAAWVTSFFRFCCVIYPKKELDARQKLFKLRCRANRLLKNCA
ncbi:MAG: hypothetical protein PHD57_08055, partial [Desulfobacterales bacterium]|nr:hypothetical protein [Desulfobacterales bacterium]MDD3082889.1 hypothetical protein [Desulfobacterales bacterium]MDD4462654.1 hypothetical protein [Desulfobacterales bacterium]